MKQFDGPIPGYESRYRISNTGQVFSIRRGRPLKPYVDKDGYLRISLYDGSKVNHYIHRMVAEVFIDNPEDLPCVNHKDFNKQNNSVDNLEWVTYKENTRHLIGNTGHIRGEKNPASKLVGGQVEEIRHLLLEGLSQRHIGFLFGVSQTCVHDINVGSTWRAVA